MSMVGPGGIGIALCLIRVQLVRYDRYIVTLMYTTYTQQREYFVVQCATADPGLSVVYQFP